MTLYTCTLMSTEKYPTIRVRREVKEALDSITKEFRVLEGKSYSEIILWLVQKVRELYLENARLKEELLLKERLLKEQNPSMADFERRFWYVFKLLLSYAQLRSALGYAPSPEYAERYFVERIREVQKRFKVDTAVLEEVLQKLKSSQLSGKELAEVNDMIRNWCLRFLLGISDDGARLITLVKEFYRAYYVDHDDERAREIAKEVIQCFGVEKVIDYGDDADIVFRDGGVISTSRDDGLERDSPLARRCIEICRKIAPEILSEEELKIVGEDAWLCVLCYVLIPASRLAGLYEQPN